MNDLRQAAQQALEAWDDPMKDLRDLCVAMDALRTKLEQQAEPVAVYGYCPACGAKGVTRERRPNGNDKCTNGHTYPSSTATPVQPLLMNHNGAVRKVHGYPPQQQAEPVADEWAKLLHYPDCWDTAAYPTLHDAVHEALAWSGCSVCKLEQQAEPLTDDEIIRASNALVFTNLNAQMQYIAFARAIEAKLKERNNG